MQVLRTIFWVLLTALLVAFIAMNWTRVPVNLWPLEGGNYMHFEWPVGIVALVFFTLGALPMWLVHRAGQWRLKRRIAALESTIPPSTAPVQTTMPEPSPAPTPAAELAPLTSLDKPAI